MYVEECSCLPNSNSLLPPVFRVYANGIRFTVEPAPSQILNKSNRSKKTINSDHQ